MLSFIVEHKDDVDKQSPQKTGSGSSKRARKMMMMKSMLENPCSALFLPQTLSIMTSDGHNR